MSSPLYSRGTYSPYGESAKRTLEPVIGQINRRIMELEEKLRELKKEKRLIKNVENKNLKLRKALEELKDGPTNRED